MTIKGKEGGAEVWGVILPFNIPWTPNRTEAQKHPEVVKRLEAVEKRYPIVEVSFRDMDI